MKHHFLRVLVVSLVLSAGAVAGTIVQNVSDVRYWVGSGENSAVVIIDWQDGKNAPGETAGQALAWGFRWPAGQTRTGQNMLQAIVDADPRLHMQLVVFGGLGNLVYGLGYDLDGDGGTFTFSTENEEAGGPSGPDDHFAQGMEFGYWNYRLGQSTGAKPSFNQSTTGFSSRTLSNGSWDVWVFQDTSDPEFAILAPALAAVPEPSSAILLLCTGAALGLRRWRVMG